MIPINVNEQTRNRLIGGVAIALVISLVAGPLIVASGNKPQAATATMAAMPPLPGTPTQAAPTDYYSALNDRLDAIERDLEPDPGMPSQAVIEHRANTCGDRAGQIAREKKLSADQWFAEFKRCLDRMNGA